MNTEAKCKCNHCSENVAFPVEMAGQTAECPNCHLVTILFIPNGQKLKTEPSPEPIGKPLRGGKFNLPAAGEGEAAQIEDKLDAIGGICLVAGKVGAGIAGIILTIIILATATNGSHDEDDTGVIVSLVIFGIVSIAQGIIIKTLFRAAAEVIRLLRKLVKNTEKPQSAAVKAAPVQSDF